MGLNTMPGAFIRKGKFEHKNRDTERRMLCENEPEIGVMHLSSKENQGG